VIELLQLLQVIIELAKSYGYGVVTLTVVLANFYLLFTLRKGHKSLLESIKIETENSLKANEELSSAIIQSMIDIIDESSIKITETILNCEKYQKYKQKSHAKSLEEIIDVLNEMNKSHSELRGMFGASLMIGQKRVK